MLSCNQHGNTAANPVQKEKSIIVIQPLSQFSDEQLAFLEDSIAKFYSVRVMITSQQKPPTTAWYAAKQRWRADTIIAFYKKLTADTVRLTAALTSDDISTTKDNIYDYGIMGLGYTPGKACVISTFRLKKNSENPKAFSMRLFKVMVHEIGHNFGLPHCTNQQCIMVDAEGKMKLDGEKGLCESCKQKLKTLL